ncbi:MAG TPA: hypothetical protein VKC82_02030 [Burkholderiales bacterium]|nr:hypothetical protein [Burkholderiales bacterium]
MALSLALTGCPLTPKLNETTPPKLYFTVWFQNASHNSDSDEISLVVGVASPNKCVFVASPFLVRVMGSDPGGVARLDMSNQGNNSLRVLNTLSKATPPPGSPTQGDPVFGTFANPGSPFDPNANGSQLSYFDFDAQKGGPVFNVANLEATFEFVAGQPPDGVFLVEAVNASGLFSRIINYRIRLAGSAPSQQPGKPCS